MYKTTVYCFAFVAAIFCLGCTEQHNPQPYWKQIRNEQAVANRPVLRLTKDGRIPGPEDLPKEEETSGIASKYQNLCSSCHGVEGKADSPTAMALKPKPRSFVDKQWQARVTDEHIGEVIRKGGAAMGLSAIMAPWSASLISDSELSELVQYIRAFGETSD